MDTIQDDPFNSIGIFATDRLYYDENNTSNASINASASIGSGSVGSASVGSGSVANRKSSMSGMSYQTATGGEMTDSQLLSQ